MIAQNELAQSDSVLCRPTYLLQLRGWWGTARHQTLCSLAFQGMAANRRTKVVAAGMRASYHLTFSRHAHTLLKRVVPASEVCTVTPEHNHVLGQ